ncbi:MAG: iron-containing redox enzyme family protein [Myxococcota bacterium]|nr:iron-containing redox enzyme family protein [Myxococcota bacterium]
MFRRPRLRSGCEFGPHVDDAPKHALRIGYEGYEFAIEFESVQQREATDHALRLLDGTREIAEISERSALPASDLECLLELLDTEHVLVNGEPVKGAILTGDQFVEELERRIFFEWVPRSGNLPLWTLFHDGQLPKDVVVGWVIESYHIVHQAHNFLSTAIAHAHGSLQRRLAEYHMQEYRHDRFFSRALESVGIDEGELRTSIPLSFTSATINLMNRWASADTLSFIAGIFIFEGNQRSQDAYMERLRDYGFPEAFVEGQAQHNEINLAENHVNITRELFAEIEAIGPTDQRRVLENIRLFVETSVKMNNEVLAYYTNPYLGVPRLASRLVGAESRSLAKAAAG